MEGFSFTWVHPSAKKMSKLDRFLVSNGIILGFLAITDVCLDRHLSDRRPILLNEIHTDFGPTLFRTFLSWFSREGFDVMVEQAWSSFTHNDSNSKNYILKTLGDIDKALDNGSVSDEFLVKRMELLNKYHELKQLDSNDAVQKSKVKNISSDEIRVAVWDCGENKSPSPDGYTFEFFRLATVISDLVSNTQSAFVAKRQILDGPFILNEVLSWCKRKMKQALVLKLILLRLTILFGGISSLILFMLLVLGRDGACGFEVFFSSNMALILVNRNPIAEFPMCCGLKQGDPLASLLFILVMETLHIFVSRAVNECIFRGLHIQGSVILSHLFYTDDAVFIGEWSDSNLDNMLRILNCFYLASGLRINVSKSQVLGIGVPSDIVQQRASRIGCDIMKTPFKYLGVMVVLHEMEMLQNNFFIRGDAQGKKITWIAWDKGAPSLDASFRRPVRDGVERSQWEDLVSLVGGISLSVFADRWVCDLTYDGEFRVRDIRTTLDNLFHPSLVVATRWVKHVPIKVNIFAWRARLDRLPTGGNLISIGVLLDSSYCPNCDLATEDSHHLFLGCDLAKSIAQKLCRWWSIQWVDVLNF
nr:RNA-directed DNA polymerase, eukaryota [Tanacetum cinerariifolium]